jgi:hypothetical protein
MATQVASPPLQCILQQRPTCAVGRRTKAAWGTRTRRCNPPIVDRVFWGNFSLGHHPVLTHPKPVRANKLQTVEALFQFGKKKVAPKVIRETVIPEPDYRVSLVLLGTAGTLFYSNNFLPAAPIGLLGLLLLYQTTSVRFVFDDEGMELKTGKQLQESRENVFVGGRNRWSYSAFTNWEFWWPAFPVLVYFKETQTKPEGQVHFFPIISNGKQLYDVLVERAGPSKTSGPK